MTCACGGMGIIFWREIRISVRGKIQNWIKNCSSSLKDPKWLILQTQLLKNKNKSHLDKKLEVVNNLIFFPFFTFLHQKK